MPRYNLIEYSSSYSKTTGSLWFYSKDEATNFNAHITNTDDFKSFKQKAKLLGSTVPQPATNADNGILKNAAIVVSLKYYATFKVSKFESLFYKINTCLQKTTTCIGLRAEEIFSVNNNTHIFQFWAWLLRFLSYVISKSSSFWKQHRKKNKKNLN